MTREKAKELLPVIQAYAEGKEIEYRLLDGTWRDNGDMDFTESWTYRIKPEPVCRPFKDIDELLEIWSKMMDRPQNTSTMPLIWVKFKRSEHDIYFHISGFDRTDNTIKAGVEWVDLKEAFEDLVFLDGAPFGVVSGCRDRRNIE